MRPAAIAITLLLAACSYGDGHTPMPDSVAWANARRCMAMGLVPSAKLNEHAQTVRITCYW